VNEFATDRYTFDQINAAVEDWSTGGFWVADFLPTRSHVTRPELLYVFIDGTEKIDVCLDTYPTPR
jgi:hypothetical protein